MSEMDDSEAQNENTPDPGKELQQLAGGLETPSAQLKALLEVFDEIHAPFEEIAKLSKTKLKDSQLEVKRKIAELGEFRKLIAAAVDNSEKWEKKQPEQNQLGKLLSDI